MNNDYTLNSIKKPGETWGAITTEPVFRKLIFADTE